MDSVHGSTSDKPNFREVMIRFLIVVSLLFSPFYLHAWDPDDETFDPTIHSVIADGATRLGDPSPFYREGYEERGFTHVGFTIPESGDPSVNLSLILPPDPDDPAKQLGGALYLPLKNARALVEALEKGADLSGTFLVWEVDWAGKWTLRFAGEEGLVFQQEHMDKTVKFTLSIPAGKKLAGALKHSIQKVEEAD